MTSWDDGTHTSVRKVRIEYGSGGINSIKVDYDKNGNLFAASKHGGSGANNDEFTLSSGEYLIGIRGYYTPTGSVDVITAITFLSNTRSIGPYGHTTRFFFSLDGPADNQIVGFYGKSSNLLNDIDAHLGPIGSVGTGNLNGSQKLGAFGSNGGNPWDDGAHDNVKQIYVGIDSLAIEYLKFEYENGGQVIIGQDRGQKSSYLPPDKITLDSDDYITSVEGVYENIFGYNDPIIVWLKFTYNTKTSDQFGIESNNGTRFVLGDKVSKIVGFHGRASDVIYQLGVYTKPAGGSSGQTPIPTPPSLKLYAQGVDIGNVWDDGFFDKVRKIHVGQGSEGIHYLKFEYEKSGQLVVGQEHGEQVQPPTEISLDPDEYLISVEGFHSYRGPTIESLQFKTNKKTTKAYGFQSGTPFSLQGIDCKITGFHGRSGKLVHQLGIYIRPTSV